MSAYTISKLAEDASISVHMIRDYELRGLLRPCKCMPNGYRIYDEQALQRLQFILAGKDAGISLTVLTELCRAMDNSDNTIVEQSMISIEGMLDQAQQAILYFRRGLSQCSESLNNKVTAR